MGCKSFRERGSQRMSLRQCMNVLIAWASFLFLFYPAFLSCSIHDLAPFLPLPPSLSFPSWSFHSSRSPVIHLISLPLLSLQTQMSGFLLVFSALCGRHLHFLAESIGKEGKSRKWRCDSADETEQMEDRGQKARPSLWVLRKAQSRLFFHVSIL